MRVAFVNQDPGIRPGRAKGAAVHLTELRAAFERAGCEVEPLDEGDDDALERRLRERRPDLVYERYTLGAERAGRVAAELGVPHVLEVNAPLLLEAERFRGRPATDADRATEARILARPTLVACVSGELADYVRRTAGGRDGVVVEPNGVAASFLADPTPPPAFATPGRLVLGFHGRVRPWHGVDRQLELVRRLVERGVDAEFALVGRGDLPAGHGLAPHRIVRVDWVPPAEVAAHVARFDLVALTWAPDSPSWFSPLKLAEAMAVGAVPLVPSRGDLPRVVRDSVDGRVLSDDLDEWFEAALALATDAELRASFARNARRSPAIRTWDAVADSILRRVPVRPGGKP